MLQLTPQNVGTAPGTTTLTIPSAAMKAPPLGGALGTVYPTDFDLYNMYGYLPYNTGWIVGDLHRPKPRGLADAAPAAPQSVQLSPAEIQANLMRLELQKAEEELRSRRSERIWGAVTGLVAVGGLIVSVIALRRS